ncbi:MAG: PHP domain-containing protein [Clostridia bacterium]|nr:PHP domain-containing protein [Clostridia bacterium]
MVRQSAFIGNGSFLKGSLHCHTNRSDGADAPEDVIRAYYEHGYHFMALTDHNIFCRMSGADVDVPMTMLSGIERDMTILGFREDRPLCVHIVGIGDPASPEGPAHDEVIPHYGRYQDCSAAQGMIDEMHSWGLKTFYCHPEWSGTTYADYRCLKGNFGVEVWNTGNVVGNGLDTGTAHSWDQALDEGRRVWGVAVDDGHFMEIHCRGWVMVRAGNSAPEILQALEEGAFYASCGPEIYDFHIRDGRAYVDCSDAAGVSFHTLRMPLRRTAGEHVTHAECDIRDGIRYVRAVVTDALGRRAWTNPIFLR